MTSHYFINTINPYVKHNMLDYEFVVPIIRAPVKARKTEKYSRGAYVSVPAKWLKQEVTVFLEGHEDIKERMVVKGSNPGLAYISVSGLLNKIEPGKDMDKWEGKYVRIELIEEKKKKGN